MNDESVDESKTPMISLGSNQELKIPPYTLNPGKYKVKITCWIYMIKLPLIANIKGGALRTVYVEKDLVLDASSSMDPNYPASRQQHLFYRFQCNETDSFCKTYNSKIAKYVIKAPIRTGVTFDFKLTVYAFNSIPSSYEQMIITTNISYASFSIMCLKNCGGENGIINPDKPLYLLATAKRAEEHDFTWSYSFTGYEKNGSKSADHISDSETYPYVKIIRPHALVDGRSYTFTVARADPGGEASISMFVGKRPSLGCTVFPRAGRALETIFRVSCVHTSSEPVIYTFYCRDTLKNTLRKFTFVQYCFVHRVFRKRLV
ncbi:kinase domain-containing protein [Homalodisca vitripennis]|nr:kinase domain-containing protein [Homalodisca vitripennis]